MSQCNSQQTVKNGRRKGRRCYKVQAVRSSVSGILPPLLAILRWCQSSCASEMYLEWHGTARWTVAVSLPHYNGLGKRSWIKIAKCAETDRENHRPRWITNPVGNKRHKFGWTAVNHWQPGIIAWAIGDRSSLTFSALGSEVLAKLLVRYRWLMLFIQVHRCLSTYIVSKTYMTRVEENTRLRHYLATTSENALLL